VAPVGQPAADLLDVVLDAAVGGRDPALADHGDAQPAHRAPHPN